MWTVGIVFLKLKSSMGIKMKLLQRYGVTKEPALFCYSPHFMNLFWTLWVVFQKYHEFCKKLTFDLSKFKFQNWLKPKTYIFGTFLRPKKKFANIIADSEPCIKYKDFGTWVSRWSKWNGGATIFSHFFLSYGLITGKPS